MAIYGIGDAALGKPTRTAGTEDEARSLAQPEANRTRRAQTLYVSYVDAQGENIWLHEDIIYPEPRIEADGAQAHQPRRDSDVEAWLSDWADSYTHDNAGRTAIERLLADYRDRADTGQPLPDDTRPGTE